MLPIIHTRPLHLLCILYSILSLIKLYGTSVFYHQLIEKYKLHFNDARYNAFTEGKFGEDCLPPNKDALLLHITRANYVAYIWRQCMNPTIDAPDFCNHGWQVNESGDLKVKWLSCLPAMDNILESASCNCKTGCTNRRCKCKKEDLTCTELCGCTECENQKPEETNEDVYE